jgi:hypothetical protein
MSTYNTITSLSESPLMEGLLYAGTDDGLIQVSEDGGETWNLQEVGGISGIPPTAFVNDIRADLFDAKTVYAALDNHKYGDFTPYLVKSDNAGRSWKSIRGNLPDRTLVWRLVQDHENQNLLFAATEFGIYFTVDGGEKWLKFTGGLPTISFRDLTIQRRENDLVAASFGRSFFVLDDYSALRQVSAELLEQEGVLFPVRDAWWYIPKRVVSAQGASDFVAENPPFGAVFTYYLKEEPVTAKQLRQKKEKELSDPDTDIPFPGWDALEAEKQETGPFLVFTVKDAQGKVVNRITSPAKKGIHRVSWNLRHASQVSISLDAGRELSNSSGYLVTPGKYTVSMSLQVQETTSQLGEAQAFEVKPLRDGALAGASYEEMETYRAELQIAQNDLRITSTHLSEAFKRIAAMKQASYQMAEELPELRARILHLEKTALDLQTNLNGYSTKAEIGEKDTPSPRERLSVASRGLSTSYGPTELHRESLKLGRSELEPLMEGVRKLTQETLPEVEQELSAAGAPWIEGEGWPESKK